MAEAGGMCPRYAGEAGARSGWRQLLGRCCLCLLFAGLALQARADLLELHAAQATLHVQGETVQHRVALPYHWDRHHPGRAGKASFDLVFELDRVPDTPWGIYLPRLGNAYEVWLNGVLLQRNGDLQQANGADYAKTPRYIALTPGMLRNHNLLRVHIRADVGRRGGLAPPVLGPEDEVQPLYKSDYRWRNTGSMAVVILSLVVGVAALALWLTQVDPSVPGRRRRPRRDRLYLYAGLAELFWTLRVSDAIIENPPLPWPWWGVATVGALAVWACSLALICIEVAGWGRLPATRWVRRWLLLLLVTSLAAAGCALVWGYPLALTLWYALLGVTYLGLLPMFLLSAVRGATLAHRMVALAVLLNTLVGVRDLYVFRFSATYSENTLQRYSSVLFGLVLATIVILRFRRASAQVRDLVSTMAQRVAQKEAELGQTYMRVEQLAREQAGTAERGRILRDMHDGVGSHISTAIRQLQYGKASQDEVLHTLHDALDQLKLSIDAMNLPSGDINALLANVRYRLEPRFLACDIQLEWAVEELEPVQRLDASAMRQLQFMIFEALSNVLQHAQASVLRIVAQPSGATDNGVQLQIIDNGRGFDDRQPPRNGLLAMQGRAQAIGAQLRLISAPGRTVVEITIV